MPTPLESLIQSGTKLWLDSVDPELVRQNRKLGATGATSNPIIISDLLKSGRFDDQLQTLMSDGCDDETIAWRLTDSLVTDAESVFKEVYESTAGNDGYVSFELDPLLEDPDNHDSVADRAAQYVALGRKWSEGHPNRMIKVPATEAGMAAMEELTAAGVTLNVTLIFTMRQYHAAREAIWRGAQRRPSQQHFKSVYSIFVSRVDVYTQKHVPELSAAAQGMVGIVNARRLWEDNQQFWKAHSLPLQQEIIFASTGVKNPEDSADKYVAALAGSDIQTNPPGTNDAIQAMTGHTFRASLREPLEDALLSEIDTKVDFEQLERVLMSEGLEKFAAPQKGLLQLIADRRSELRTAG
jgi:transaldolase